jgi:hypothetical protein
VYWILRTKRKGKMTMVMTMMRGFRKTEMSSSSEKERRWSGLRENLDLDKQQKGLLNQPTSMLTQYWQYRERWFRLTDLPSDSPLLSAFNPFQDLNSQISSNAAYRSCFPHSRGARQRKHAPIPGAKSGFFRREIVEVECLGEEGLDVGDLFLVDG